MHTHLQQGHDLLSAIQPSEVEGGVTLLVAQTRLRVGSAGVGGRAGGMEGEGDE